MLKDAPGLEVTSISPEASYQYNLSRWVRLKEVLVTTLVGWIPTIALGIFLRRLVYRTVLARMGNSVSIQDGAEFIGFSNIEVGDNVWISRNARLNGRGQNSRIRIESGVSLERGVIIESGENCCIDIGKNTFINVYAYISGPGRLKIGNNCRIGPHSGIYAGTHQFADLTGDQEDTYKGIVIEDGCWLGHGVTVLDGVTIGQGSMIGAGAVVTKDIPPYSVAVGVPARVIKQRKE